jgi:deoxyribodipyrimidine photo-lyase
LFSSELICEEDFETLCNAKLGSFTKFRLQVEKEIKLAAPLAVIEIPASEQKSSKLIDFKNEAHPCEMIHFTEGEYYLNWYFESPTRALRYKETRDALMGFHHSTKFSLFLNFGFLSPRQILARLKAFEAKHGTNESTYWIFFELLWREYFRLYGYKYGSKIFKREGPKSLFSASASTTTSHQDVPERIERKLFWSWALGLTEFSFINACMNELRTTGWLSNRGRQNAASYLAKTLKVNWVWGAKWFEYCLLDYDACSNWGNWNYLAGVGSDPRDRTFNVDFQATRYDPEGLYQARFSSRA